MYALLVFAHFGGVGEKAGGEERSVKVCGGRGVDGSCSQARRGKYRSGEPGGRERKHDICTGAEVRQKGKAISKTWLME
jgi:hypothetical protein